MNKDLSSSSDNTKLENEMDSSSFANGLSVEMNRPNNFNAISPKMVRSNESKPHLTEPIHKIEQDREISESNCEDMKVKL